MIDADTGENVPTDLDATFEVIVSDGVTFDWLIEDGAPIGVHEVEYRGQTYRIVCSIELIE